MVHSVSGWTRGVQVKLRDHLRTCAIPERLRGAFTTRRYTNSRLPLPLPSYVCAIFGKNRSRNATVRVLADGQTDTLTDANRFYNLSHAICYGTLCPICYGTDNKNNNRRRSTWSERLQLLLDGVLHSSDELR